MRERIHFDENDARRLVHALEEASDGLFQISSGLSHSIGVAMRDFAGGYADAFRHSHEAAQLNHRRLSETLDELAQQVRTTILRAAEEQARLDRYVAWQWREAERQRRQALTAGIAGTAEGLWDREPAEDPIRARPLEAVFFPQRYPRTPSGRGRVSSAVPEGLRAYARSLHYGALTRRDSAAARSAAWAGFVASCGWARIEWVDIHNGFERVLDDLDDDALWLERIADLFSAAGGVAGGCGHSAAPVRTLSVAVLTIAADPRTPLTDTALLKALATLSHDDLVALLKAEPDIEARLAAMDPVEVSAWWARMGPPEGSTERFSAQQTTLLTALPELFGNLEGLPYTARDHANRIALDAAIAELEVDLQSAAMTWPPTPESARVLEQHHALINIREALELPDDDSASRFLISLTRDHPPLAAVSIGDLDTAHSVTWAVPGMNTTTHKMVDWTDAAQNIHGSLGDGHAVVAWIGYETPTPASVFSSELATSGGAALARTLQGLRAARSLSDTPLEITIVAHSYGTTTTAVALTTPGVAVDNVIMLGSAGLPDSISDASTLHADHVYAGQARDVLPGLEDGQGDQLAWVGRVGSIDHHTNPVTPDFGAETFGTDTGGIAGKPVTDHGVHVEDPGGDGYLDPRTESLQNVVRVITHETEDLTVYSPKGPTALQEPLIEIGRLGTGS